MKTMLSVFAAVLMMGAMSTKAQADYCEYEIINAFGESLSTFQGFGYNRLDACVEAEDSCRHSLRAGYYRGVGLRCVEKISGGWGGYTTETCRAQMLSPRGTLIQTFIGRANGRRGAALKTQACREALRDCNREKVRTARTVAICTVEGNPGPLPPVPRPNPRPGRGGRGGRI